MLDGPHGLFGGGHVPLSAPYSGLVPAVDRNRKVQSPVTPMLYRYAAKAASLQEDDRWFESTQDYFDAMPRYANG